MIQEPSADGIPIGRMKSEMIALVSGELSLLVCDEKVGRCPRFSGNARRRRIKGREWERFKRWLDRRHRLEENLRAARMSMDRKILTDAINGQWRARLGEWAPQISFGGATNG